MNEIILIPVLVFLVLLFVSLAIYLLVGKKKKKEELISKIDKYVPPDRTAELNFQNTESPFQKYFTGMLAWFAKYGKPKNEEELSRRRKNLVMAGYRRPGNLVVFYGAKVFLTIVLPSMILALNVLLGVHFERNVLIILLVLMALLGYFLPNLWVQLKIIDRQDKIRRGFPDALDLMVVCVEAGMGLDQAIKKISDEMKLKNKVISEEFSLMNLEMRAGRSRQDAMRNLAARTGVDDVKSLITLLLQTDKFGTSIAQALRVHSATMRTKRRQKAEEQAAKLPVKMLFPLIFFIFPAIFIVIVGPAIIRIYRAIIQQGNF